MDITGYIITAIVGYLLGSIPTGFLVAKARGVDIRTVGSKNMGATNVFRTLGKGPGIFVLFVDAAKGFIACFCAGDWLLTVFNISNPDPQMNHLVGGIAAVLGLDAEQVRAVCVEAANGALRIALDKNPNKLLFACLPSKVRKSSKGCWACRLGLATIACHACKASNAKPMDLRSSSSAITRKES